MVEDGIFGHLKGVKMMLNTKLIMVEGIPGSGKSTTAVKIKEYFDSRCIPSKLYQESDCGNPSDYAWVSVITEEEYHNLIKGYHEYEHIIQQYTEKDNDNILVYYQKMKNVSGMHFPEKMMEFLSQREPYDGKLSVNEFCRLHLNRYRKFSGKTSDKNEITIFESSFLQNQVNELLGFHNLDKSLITKYLLELAQCYKDLNPLLIYLSQPNVFTTIRKVADERCSPDVNKHPHWIDHVINYISNSLYGKANNLHGFEGAVRYFERRKEIELEVIEHLKMHTIIIENSDYNKDKGIAQVIDAIEKIN